MMIMRRQSAAWLISGFIIAAVSAPMVMPKLANMSPAIAQQGHAHPTGTPNSSSQGDAFAQALSAAMDKMHKDMMSPMPTGDADRDFLATMIPHHEGAVEMARLVLIHGSDPLVRRLAEEIIAGQQTEIEAMRARLRILSNGADPSPESYPPLGSTRGVGQ
jgi:uncharacterized protein (DUF305 family)